MRGHVFSLWILILSLFSWLNRNWSILSIILNEKKSTLPLLVENPPAPPKNKYIYFYIYYIYNNIYFLMYLNQNYIFT